MWESFVILIPFLGTSLGGSMVFFMKNKISIPVEKALLGFAAGVMVAASIWSLLQPSIDMATEQGKVAFVPATVGFLLGIFFFVCLDFMMPQGGLECESLRVAKISKTRMLFLAMTLHNIPEGMAVGVMLASANMQTAGVTMAEALALSIGIGIQNFPEGAIISMPLRGVGISKRKAFFYGVLSGIVEPIGAVFTVILARHIIPILPYFLSFAAGAMLYVVTEELMADVQAGEHRNIGMAGMLLGFALMMVLDVALG